MECIIDTPQQKYIDFESLYALVVDPTTVKPQNCHTEAASSYSLIYDIINAFQNCFAKAGHEIYVTVPPCNLEWLYEEEGFKYN